MSSNDNTQKEQKSGLSQMSDAAYNGAVGTKDFAVDTTTKGVGLAADGVSAAVGAVGSAASLIGNTAAGLFSGAGQTVSDATTATSNFVQGNKPQGKNASDAEDKQ
ncbi:hypothetical protein PROFUN_02422 [Planoprotostelium fungivorum]|uniref:Uncharacterized protein n=1 Tax=Planoprotostelium fungivorum TaxID=1890364 RepID=A0A2P6NUS5_9EUKA|nr:hypothetical protein PROFUN_02422 [Planoprotostelium fungivorum]